MEKQVYSADLKSAALKRHPGSTPGTRTNYRRSCMSKQKDVINRAYGNVPKEIGYWYDWNFVPSWRGVRYYWHKLIRKVTR